MIKTLGRAALRPFLGKRRFQPMWELIYQVSLAGLSFGEGADPNTSGERFVMDLVKRRAEQRDRRPVLLDVGANRGVYTRALLDVFGADADIWAFEPAESTFNVLASEVGGIPNVRLRNIGLGNEEGVATLYSPGEAAKMASVYDRSERLERFGMSVTRTEPITLTTVDRFLADEGIEHVDLLKLDVEGHELKVLEGASHSLADGKVDAIQFEFADVNVQSRTFFRDFYTLLTPRYTLHRVLQDGLWPIERYSEIYEVFKRATNYVALPR